MDQCHRRSKEKQGSAGSFFGPTPVLRPTTAHVVPYLGRGRSDRLRVDGRLRAALRRIRTAAPWARQGSGLEATSFSEQAPAARRDYFAGSNSDVCDGGAGWGKSGIVDAAGILVGQDVCDVGDVSRSSRATPGGGAGGSLPERNVIVGVGPPSTSAATSEPAV